MNKLNGMRSFFCLLFAITVCSCQSNNSKDIQRIVDKWMERKIIIPSGNIIYKTMGKDTVCTDLWEKTFKIFTYVDSVGCTSCRLGLPKWKNLIDSCKIQKWDISFLFVVHSNDYEEFEDAVRYFEFDYPVIYDYANAFEKHNRFPPEPYRTFLLDKDNKVQLIGSPIENPNLWELYKRVIT